MIELRGTELANKRRDELKARTNSFARAPKLVAFFAGSDPSTESYIRSKEKIANKIGIDFELKKFASEVAETDIIDELIKAGKSDSVDGIIIEKPLPSHIDDFKVGSQLNPAKDVDSVSAENLGLVMKGCPRFIPGTVLGVKWVLDGYDIDPDGKDLVIVGRSEIVGLPLANLLLQKSAGANATVTVCHSHTSNLSEHTRRADILVAAAGQANLITGDMIKEGAIIIDVGINFVDGKLVGDVDYEGIQGKASMATPVPGGVGPLTVTALLYNTIESFEQA